MKRVLLPPLIDLVFKKLYGDPHNAELLRSLLGAILSLPVDEYSKFEFLDTYLKPDTGGGKLAILDVKVRTKSGKIIDIEIQLFRVTAFRSRILFYMAQMLVQQINKGDPYSKIKSVISIIIADHSFISKEEERDYHNVYHLANQKSHKPFTNLVEIHTIELDKAPAGGDGTLLGNWLQFLKSKTEEEFAMIAQADPVIAKAVDILVEMSADEQLRTEAFYRDKALHDYNTLMEEALTEGIEKGRYEQARESAIKLKRQHIPLQIIADSLGLSVEEVERL